MRESVSKSLVDFCINHLLLCILIDNYFVFIPIKSCLYCPLSIINIYILFIANFNFGPSPLQLHKSTYFLLWYIYPYLWFGPYMYYIYFESNDFIGWGPNLLILLHILYSMKFCVRVYLSLDHPSATWAITHTKTNPSLLFSPLQEKQWQSATFPPHPGVLIKIFLWPAFDAVKRPFFLSLEFITNYYGHAIPT